MSSQVSAVVYGKHKAFGDFLNLGLPPENLAVLDTWLDHVLPELRQRLGQNWARVWSACWQTQGVMMRHWPSLPAVLGGGRRLTQGVRDGWPATTCQMRLRLSGC